MDAFTNMLDYGAEHFKLRQLDMPRNFFSGNNCVAEYGQFPSNFLLGVSTPASDIQFRRQMRSRLGEPITVAGNPPMKFASASFETENETHRLPDFRLFLTRVFLFDFFSIGILPITEGLVFTILFICLLRSRRRSGRQRARCVGAHGGHSGPVLRRDQEAPRRQQMGSRSRDALLVLEALRLFLRAGLLLRLVQGASEVLRRDDPFKSHPAVDGMPDRAPDDRDSADAVLRLERGELWQRLRRRRPSCSFTPSRT